MATAVGGRGLAQPMLHHVFTGDLGVRVQALPELVDNRYLRLAALIRWPTALGSLLVDLDHLGSVSR
jgi:hypothetical protein